MAKSMAVYLLFENCGLGQSLFKIDLPAMDCIERSESSASTISINPILSLSGLECPHMMSCTQLGSKLYFFGGVTNKPPPPPRGTDKYELLNHVLPRDVCVFDTTKGSPEMGAKMESGKVCPIVFVSKGMVYVLSPGRAVSGQLWWWFYYHKINKTNSVDLMGTVKLFERYDPVANKWKVLDDSPLRSLSHLNGFLLLEDHKVVITLEGNVGHLVYDLDKDVWLPYYSSSSLIPNMLKLVDNGESCHYVGGFCYGVLPPKHRLFQLGPLKDVDSKLTNLKLSVVDVPFALPAMIHTSKLQHLGGGYFILVSASRANDNLGIPQPITRRVLINIFKDLLPTAGQFDTASSSNAKIVFSQNYVCNMDFSCDGEFLRCFLVPPTGRTGQIIEDHEPFEGEALFRDVPAKNDRSSGSIWG